MAAQNINDSMASFTNRVATAWRGDGYGWALHDIGHWRRYYIEHPLAKKAIDQIPEDAFRKGYSWGGATPEEVNKLDETERRLKVKDTKKRALLFSRLDGEAYIYMDDGNPSDQPFDYEAVRRDGLRFINLLRINDVVKGPWDTDPISAYYMQPQWYQVVSSVGDQVIIHPSRMVRFIRNPDPNNGLGISDLVFFHDAIEMLERAEENVSELTTEARIDVMGVEGLMQMVQDPEAEAALVRRYGFLAENKKTNKVIVKDLKCEDYQQKQTHFANLDTIIETYRRGYCAATKVAYSLVYGRQGGLGSNGETDLKSYYDNIHTVQRVEVSDPCFALNEAIIRSALGSRPDEIFVDWLPLHETSDSERVENAVKIANAVKTLVESKVMPAEVLTEPTVNWLTELNTLPGLEQAYNEWEEGGGQLNEPIDETDVMGRAPLPEDQPEDGEIPEPIVDADIEQRKSLWDSVNAILKRRTDR